MGELKQGMSPRDVVAEMDGRYALFGLLFALQNRLQAVGDTFYEEITSKQFFLMACMNLFQGEAPTVQDLAQVMGSSHQNVKQIINKLDENNVCPAEYIYSALKEVEFEYGFVDSIPKDGARCYALEGYIFPDTYDFFVSEKQNGIGENPTSIINKFLGNFESKWSEVYTKRAEELGLTKDEVIIIASIIQKEAADKSQMGKVSSVIHNRLNNPSSYPTLGCDSTKKYVNNYLAPVLGTAGASSYLGGYDTNSIRSGLPVGPICNPGVDAIEAALNPDDTDYFYFCHNEAGKIYMAKTYSEFQANWAQVLRDNEAY